MYKAKTSVSKIAIKDNCSTEDPGLEIDSEIAEIMNYSKHCRCAIKSGEEKDLKIVKEIDFNSGVIKGDFVIHKNKVKIIEFAGRLSGGDFSESLVPLSTGKNSAQWN